MDWVALIAGRKIKEAMDNGEFDDNPLKGQPIDLDEDASLTPEQRVTRKILKNAGALPQWMQMEVDIRREREAVDKLRTRAQRLLEQPNTPEAKARILNRLRRELKEQMDLVNTMILQYNMICPSGYARPFAPYGIAKELEALGKQSVIDSTL